MGYVGPRRIDFKDVVKPETAPPFRTVDNPDSPLDVADIVLIDPVGTGFSRLLPEGEPDQFYGTAQDAKVTVELIQRWTRENGHGGTRRSFCSPKSYGTIRAAVVSEIARGWPNGNRLDGRHHAQRCHSARSVDGYGRFCWR